MLNEPIVNIAGYKFVPLDNLYELREQILAMALEVGLKGTILLAPEGINLFIAGTPTHVGAFLLQLRRDPRFCDFCVKESGSNYAPFQRMLVRVKREIIAFGDSSINPSIHKAPQLTAVELKKWLDENRPLTLLDVRNNFEIELGTFDNAVPIGIDHFREFPTAVQQLPTQMKEQPMVMFCTGGIRCEKAGLFMQREGFRNLYQLEGGILKYFETCGDVHFHGECFVFDQRVALDGQLHKTDTTQCYVCQATLSVDEQASPLYREGLSCPHCHQSEQERMEKRIQVRHQQIDEATQPLPGSVPYENRLPVNVSHRFDGWSLIDFLHQIHPHVGRQVWLRVCAEGLLRKNNVPVDADHKIRTSERYERVLPQTVEPDVDRKIKILFEDEALIVIDKPAPLPMHPSGRYHRNTLVYILRHVFKPQKPRNAHRLDANTSGVVVFSKTRHIASLLQPQFQQGKVAKEYLVRVHGTPQQKEFVCSAPIGLDPQQAGARIVDAAGRASRTEFSVLRAFDRHTTLLRARPITGRTNQIRIHAWHLGFPVCGDPVYLRDGTLGQRQTLTVTDPPLCLHATKLAFQHPLREVPVSFESPLPEWSQDSRHSKAEDVAHDDSSG